MRTWEVIHEGGVYWDHMIANNVDADAIETDNLELAEAICEFLNQREAERAKPGINEEETE